MALGSLHDALVGTLAAAAGDDVRSIAIAYIGGVGRPRGEAGVYDAILAAAFEHAAKGGPPSSIYVGTYADVFEKRSVRADALRTAWQKLAGGGAIKPEFADAPWRLGSIIALFAVVRIRPRTRIIRVYVAIVVIGAGLAGLVGRASNWLGSTGVSPVTGVILSVVLAAIAGLLLPELATNDPKADLKANGRSAPQS